MATVIKPGDIFLTRGNALISRLIRFFSTKIGESRTMVNHVGVVVEEGTLQTCVVVEALSRVKHHKLWEQYGPPDNDSVAIYRSINLTSEEIDKIVKYANKQVGRKYGYFKIVTHLLDWFFFGVYFFRRFTNNGQYPICSWLVAYAFAEADKNFDVAPGAAEPDDIWDFVNKNKDKYEEVYPLSRLER
jgi:hypothetical protein